MTAQSIGLNTKLPAKPTCRTNLTERERNECCGSKRGGGLGLFAG